MNNLPESPTSVTYSVTSPKGFNALVTIRDAEFKELATKMTFVEEWFEKNGYKPQVKGFAKKEVEYVGTCPKCSGRLVKKVSKAGKTYHACENGKYDFNTKTTIGCNFVDWLEPKVEFNNQKPYEGGNEIPVEEYDI